MSDSPEPEPLRTADVDRRLLAAVERLGRAIRAARQDVATTHGLSLLGLQIIDVVDRGGVQTVGAIASELDVRQPTISDAVATLEKRGLVTRRSGRSDRRVTEVLLTPRGSSLQAQINTDLAPVLASPELDGDTDPTYEAHRGRALEAVLEEIRRLQRAGVITVNRSCLSCAHYHAGEGDEPARCMLLDEEMPPAALRVDCPDHLAA
ncbi:MAG: MarR family winged helix-turn-helix transcriptional regulator [Microthrixaceae bacterium]